MSSDDFSSGVDAFESASPGAGVFAPGYGYGAQNDPHVFLGTIKGGHIVKDDTGGGWHTYKTQDRPNITTSSQAYNLWLDWDEGQRSKFRAALTLTGLDTSGYRDADWANAWKAYVDQAAGYYRDGQGSNISPWDILAMDRREREAQIPKTTTQTSSSVNLSSKADVEASAYDIARALLGRAPTDDEVAKYTEVINAKERANPNVTTTTTTTKGGEVLNQSSTTSGGFSAQAAQNELRKQAQGEDDYAEYQAATTYYNALYQMLGGG